MKLFLFLSVLAFSLSSLIDHNEIDLQKNTLSKKINDSTFTVACGSAMRANCKPAKPPTKKHHFSLETIV